MLKADELKRSFTVFGFHHRWEKTVLNLGDFLFFRDDCVTVVKNETSPTMLIQLNAGPERIELQRRA